MNTRLACRALGYALVSIFPMLVLASFAILAWALGSAFIDDPSAFLRSFALELALPILGIGAFFGSVYATAHFGSLLLKRTAPSSTIVADEDVER